MEYPQKIMKLTQLVKEGFPKEFLMDAFRDPEQDFAWKINPLAPNSPILFDTEAFERYRAKLVDNQRAINKRPQGVM